MSAYGVQVGILIHRTTPAKKNSRRLLRAFGARNPVRKGTPMASNFPKKEDVGALNPPQQGGRVQRIPES